MTASETPHDDETLSEVQELGWLVDTEHATRRPYETGIPPILAVGHDIYARPPLVLDLKAQR